MMIFWILATGLIGLALLFVVSPLLRQEASGDAPEQDTLNLEIFRQRLQELDADLAAGSLDQAQYEAARHDLERDLLHNIDRAGPDQSPAKSTSRVGRWLLAGLLGLAVPAVSLLLYLELGDQGIMQRLEDTAAGQPDQAGGHEGQGMPSMEVLVARLEERMKDQPGNLEGWLMLGRTYFSIGQPDKGLTALEKAYAIAPEQPEVMLAYAEAVAANRPDRSLEGQPAELIGAAVAKAPDNPSGRWLLGMLAFQRGQYEDAATAWQQVLDAMEPGSDQAKEMAQMIADARQRGGLPREAPSTSARPDSQSAITATPTATTPPPGEPSPPQASSGTATVPPSPPLTEQPAAGAGTITTSVALDAGIAGQTSPEDIVFVFARAAEGPPMPLAVQRLQVKDLPTTVTLDDSMAMMPAMRLSAFPRVVIGARVSKNGQATPQSGDLEGEVGPLDLAETGKVSLTIDRIRP